MLHDEDTSGIVGVILAGGQSTRMGVRKELLRLSSGRRMVDFVVDSLRPLCTKIVFSLPALSGGDLGAPGYPVISDRLPDLGPLSGIESALSSGIAGTYLFVCCDQPRVTTALLARLLLVSQDSSAAFFQSPDRFALPFPCLIRSELAPLAKELLASDSRSIRSFARRCQPQLLVTSTGEQDLLASVNTPDELALFEDELKAMIGRQSVDGVILLDEPIQENG